MKIKLSHRFIAAMTIALHLFTYSNPAFADGPVIMDAQGNVVSTSDGTNTTATLLAGQVYHTANADLAEGQSLTFNVLTPEGLADAAARAIVEILGDSATTWASGASLTVNGIVDLLNQNGYNIEAGFQGNVNGGLILSTLPINQAEFFSGLNELARGFNQDPSAIVNKGNWNVSESSFLAMVASAINNQGHITANGGAVALAVGDKVKLNVGDNGGLISVSVDKPVDLEVKDADGNVIKEAIANSGTIKADAGIVILSASGKQEVFDQLINHSGVIEANTISNQGGKIILDGGDEGIVSVTGTLNAKGNDLGEKGGIVQVLGNKVGLFAGATVDVSGYNGGGTALIGGDYQGLGSVRNAAAVYIDPFAVIKADALLDGNGGKIIVWGNESAQVHGILSARGGELSGDGGLIETSGGYLNVDGSAIDASAPAGNAGTWLLDPYKITLGSGGSNTAGGIFTAGADSTVNVNDINTQLSGGTNVTITANAANGDIELAAGFNIAKTGFVGAATLTLNATRDILIKGTIGAGVGLVGALNLIFNSTTNGDVAISNSINTNGGNLTATTAGGKIDLNHTNADIVTSGGFVSFTANGNNDIKLSNAGSSITTAGGAVTILASKGTDINGFINSGAADIIITGSNGDVKIGNALTTINKDITLNATNDVTLDTAAADITTSGGKFTANADSDNSGAGTFTKTASGSSVSTSGGDITGGGASVDINGVFNSGAGKIDLTAKNTTLKVSNNLTTSGGNITLTAKTDVSLDNAASAITTNGGKYTVVADSDANGSGDYKQTNAGSAVNTNGGEISITADDFDLSGTHNAGSGAASLLLSKAGTSLRVGSGGSALNSDLSGAELQTITANGLTIGGSNASTISVRGITAANSNNISGTTKFNATSATGTVTFDTAASTFNTLEVNAGNGVTLNQNVTTDTGGMAFNADSDASGAGTFTVATGVTANSGGKDISVTANDIALNGTGAINAGAGIVSLITSKSGTTIGLGGGTGVFNLTDAEIDKVTASRLEIGANDAGDIQIDSISPGNTSSLVLRSGGAITDNNVPSADNDVAVDVAVTNLGLKAGGIVDLDLAVDTLAVDAGGVVDVSDANGFNIGTVGNISGLTLTNQDFTLSGGDFNFTSPINLGTGTLTINSTGSVTSTIDGTADLIADNIAISAVNGIILEINAKVLAFLNSTTGNVSIEDMASGLIIGVVGAITGGTNLGGTTTIITHSPLTIAADMIQAATINLSAGEAAGAGDDLTINAGVTVQATGAGSDVNLNAGDNVVIDGTVISDADEVAVTAGAGDTDTFGSINITGSVTAATTATLSAVEAITNTGAATDVTAVSLSATASTGIDLDTTVTNLTASNTGAGNVILNEADGANVLNVNAANGDATVTSTTGDLAVTTVGASGTATITSTAGAITDANAGANNVTAASLSATAATGIDLDTTVTNLTASNTGAGNIILNEADGANVLNVNAANGDATVTSTTGDLAVTTVGASGTATLTSTGGAITDANAGATNVTAASLAADANTTIDLDTNVSNLTVSSTTGGNITVDETDAVNVVNFFTNGLFGLTANGLIDFTGAGASTAGTLNLTTTAGGIDDSNAAGTITVSGTSTLAAGAGNNITLDNANELNDVTITSGNNVTLNDVTGIALNASTVSGSLGVTAAGTITDNGALTVTGATTLAAGSGNNITLDNLNDFSSVGITSGNNVTLNDINALQLDASTISGTLGVTTAGDLTDNGAIAVTGTTSLTAGTGDITLDNANDFGGVVTVVSANNVDLKDVNSLNVASTTVTGNFSATADSDNNTAAASLTAGAINADSVTLSGGTDLDDVINLNGGLTSTAGGITVQNAATVNVADSISFTATGGPISMVTGVAQILLNGAAATTNTFTTNGDDAINLGKVTGTDVNLTVASNGDVSLDDVNLGANGDLTVDVDNDDDGANTGTFEDITVNDLDIEGHTLLSADENFTYNGVINISGDLNMGGVGILTFNNDVTAKSITLHDISNRVELGQNVDLTSNNGVISIFNNVLSILLAGAAGTNIFDANGDATLNLSATNGITATNNPNLTLNSEGDITTSSVNIGTGTLTVAVDNDADTTNTGGFGALTAGTISAGGTSDDNLDFNAAVVANTAGLTISNANNVDFDSTINTATTLTQTAGSGTTTFSGLATVGSDADITTGSIAFNGANGSINANAGAGAVKLTAQNAAGTGITSGTAASDVAAGSLEASSANGIDLDTNIDNLAFNNTAGAVAVRNTGALTVNNVGSLATSSNTGTTTTLSAASPVTFAVNTTSAGDLTATAGESGAAGDDVTVNAGVTVKSTGGNVLLRAGDDVNLAATSAAQSDTGSVTLTGGFSDGGDTFGSVILGGTVTAATNAIITALIGSVNGAGLVTASSADIDAITGIGNTTPLNTAVSNISADSTNGNIDISNVLGSAVNATSLTTGTGTINFEQTGGGALNVTTATTGNGSITVNVDSANLNVTTITAGGTGDIDLATTTSGNVNIDNVTAAGNDITINSIGAIEELNVDAGADLTSDTMTLASAAGVGHAAQLEIDAVTLTSASVSGTGNIDLSDVAGGLAVTSATTNDGSITIDAVAGNLDVTTATANGAARNIDLRTTTSGNVNIETVTAAGDLVTVNSAGNINGISGANLTTANTIDLDAVTGIGNSQALNTAASFISADNSSNGDIDINNALAAAAVATSLTTLDGTIDFDQTGGGDLTVTNATTANGTITVTNAGGNLTATTVLAGNGGGTGDVNLTTTTAGTSGSIFVGNVQALNDTVNVNSVNEIQDTDAPDTPLVANISAGTINLNTNGGNIGVGTNYLDIQPSTIWNATTLGGDLYVNCIGVCPTGVIDLGDGNGYLAVGTMVDANDDVFGEAPLSTGAVNLIAGSFEIDSANGIGQLLPGNIIDGIEMRLRDFGGGGVGTADGKFIADGGTGPVYVSNLGAGFGLTLDTNGGTLTSVTGTGDMIILSGSPLTVNVDVTGGADVTLSALGSANTDDLTVNPNVTVSSTGAGDVLLTSGGRILLDTNAVVSTTGAGTVTAASGEDYTDFTLDQDGHVNGDIRMNNGSAFRSADGNILVDARRNARLEEVNADSNGDNTRGDVIVRGRTGAISDRNGNTVNITGDHLTLEAVTGIGDGAVLDGTVLETNVNTINLTNTTSGDVNITEVNAGGALDIEKATQDAPTGLLNILTTNGHLTVLAAGSGGLGVSSQAGEMLLQANGGGSNDDLIVNNTVTSTTGKINLDSTSRDVNFSADGDVTATGGGEIEVNANRDIFMADGTVLQANAGGPAGAIDLDAGRDITLGSVQTTSTASTNLTGASPSTFDAVAIDAGRAVIDGGDTDTDIIAESGQTTINAVRGIGDADQIDTQILALKATNTTANDIRLRELAAGGTLDLVGVTQQAANGQLNIRTQNGTLTVLAAAAGGLGVSAIDGATRLFAQDSDVSGGDNLVINHTVRSADGKINLDSENDVIASALGDVTAGDTALKLGATGAEIEVDAIGAITMADGTIFNANAGGAAGGIDMDAQTGDITLGSVQTTSQLDNAVTIVTRDGKIIDGGDTDTNIVTGAATVGVTGTGGGMLLKASTGIGSRGTGVGTLNPNNIANNFATDAIDTQGGRLAAQTETGDIQISNTGLLEITTLSDNDGGTPLGSLGAGTVTGVLNNDSAHTDPNSIIFITTHSPMVVSSAVTNLDGGNISLYALGSTAADTMDINANVQTQNGNGDVRLVSGGSMTMGAGVQVSTEGDGVTSGTGRAFVGAGYDATGKTQDEALTPGTLLTDPSTTLFDTVGSAAADLTMDESSRIWTEDGNIVVDVQDTFTVGRVDADGNAGTGLTDGTRGDITTFSRNGSTLDAVAGPDAGNQNLDFLANTLTMFSGGTIGTGPDHIELDAPFFNAFALGDVYTDASGQNSVLTNITSANGNIFHTTTGDMLLGHASAEKGRVNLSAGGSILSTGGSDTRVIAHDIIELSAGNVIGTANDPINTQMNSSTPTMFLFAGGSNNGLSMNVRGNISPLSVQIINNSPGLALFNGIAVGGESLDDLTKDSSSIYVNPLPILNNQTGQFDGRYTADFPGIFNMAQFGQPLPSAINTGALDAITLPELGVPAVLPIPAPAVPTEEERKKIAAQEKAENPPAVVPIPKEAAPSKPSTSEKTGN